MSQQPGIGVGGFNLQGGDWVTQTSPVLGPQARENVYRWATVTDDSPLEIRLDGDTLPLPLVPESLIEAGPPPVDSRVWVQLFGRRVIVLGVFGGLRDAGLTTAIANIATHEGEINTLQTEMDAEQAATAALGQYTSFTPAWTGATLGSGAVNEGRWCRIGDVVHWQVRIQFGTTPTFSAELRVNLPVTAWTGGGSMLQMTLGSWVYRDTSLVNHHGGSVGAYSGTGADASFAAAWDPATPAPHKRVGLVGGSSLPFAPAIDDVFSAGGTYMAD